MINEKRIKKMTACLTDAFQPTYLNIIDESHKHVGHEGAKSGMGHFRLEISADALNGIPAIKAHRLIYDALGDLMATDIHALTIHIQATAQPNNLA